MNADDAVNDHAATDSDALNALQSHEDGSANHPPTPTDDSDADSNASDNPNAEAAKWRRKLRTTEAELATVREQLGRYQRAAIELVAAKYLEVPADLFDIGLVDMAALLDENGDLDATKIHNAAEELLAKRPRLATVARRTGVRHPNWGQGQTGEVRRSGGSWNKLISG
ncbi:hypothetical protein [Nocardia sp. NPDC127526]|uniref:hypothetical protein n=1 Tax=Nocardia sp. NPDC127526 TaxID=3345393 RepID=UPI00363BE20C